MEKQKAIETISQIIKQNRYDTEIYIKVCQWLRELKFNKRLL